MSRPIRFGLLVALVTLIGVQLVQDVRQGSGVIDFTSDYVSGSLWRGGEEPYGAVWKLHVAGEQVAYEGRNPHTPFYVVALSPLTLLSHEAARLLLLAVSVAALLAAGILFVRRRGLPWILGLVPLALPIAHYDLLYGNTSSILLLLLVVAWLLLEDGRERSAGVVLGVAAALKVFPILLVVWLWRRHRPAAWGLAGAAGFCSLLGVVTLGWDSAWLWLTEASPGNLASWAAKIENISIAGYLAKAFGWAPIWGLAGAAIAVMAMWRWAGSLWQAVGWAVLGSPIAWSHYTLAVLPRLADLSPRLAGGCLLALAGAILWPPLATAALVAVVWPREAEKPHLQVVDLDAGLPVRTIDLTEGAVARR